MDWSDQFNSYVVPLYTKKTLPKGITNVDIMCRFNCAECGEMLYFTSESLSEILTDIQYVSFLDIKEVTVLGICTDDSCHSIIDLTDSIQYLL